MSTAKTKPNRGLTRHGKLENRKGEVIADYVDGFTWTALCEKYDCARPSLWEFLDKHETEIEEMRAKVRKAVEDYTIAHKVNRIAALDEDWRKLGQIMEERAADTRYDEPGYSTGRMVHTIKMIGSGDNAIPVDEYKVDTGTIALRAELARKAAEELGDLPKSDSGSGSNTFVLIRERIIERDSRLEPLG